MCFTEKSFSHPSPGCTLRSLTVNKMSARIVSPLPLYREVNMAARDVAPPPCPLCNFQRGRNVGGYVPRHVRYEDSDRACLEMVRWVHNVSPAPLPCQSSKKPDVLHASACIYIPPFRPAKDHISMPKNTTTSIPYKSTSHYIDDQQYRHSEEDVVGRVKGGGRKEKKRGQAKPNRAQPHNRHPLHTQQPDYADTFCSFIICN